MDREESPVAALVIEIANAKPPMEEKPAKRWVRRQHEKRAASEPPRYGRNKEAC